MPTWADPAVNYLYAKGLSSGIDANTFGANNLASVYDYTTFVLKSLGYGADDFTYKGSLDFAASIGLITAGEKETLLSKTFTREDMILLTYKAIRSKKKDGSVLSEDAKNHFKVKHETFTMTFTDEDVKNNRQVENALFTISFNKQRGMDMISLYLKPSFNKYQGRYFVMKTIEDHKTSYDYFLPYIPHEQPMRLKSTSFRMKPTNTITMELIDLEEFYNTSPDVVYDAPITVMPFSAFDSQREKILNAPGWYISSSSQLGALYRNAGPTDKAIYEMVLRLKFSKNKDPYALGGLEVKRSFFIENPTIEFYEYGENYISYGTEGILKISKPNKDFSPIIVLLDDNLNPSEYLIFE